LHGLLAKTPARAGVAFSVLDPPPNASREERSYWGSQFDQFWVSFDMPMHALAIEWLSASGAPQIPVRYDPRNPGDFLFEEAFAAASAGGSRPLSIALGIVLGGFGLFVLVFAVSLLTAGTTTVWVPRVLFCAILVSIPFASPYLRSAAAYLGLPPLPLSFLEEWTRSTDPRGRAGFLEELSASQQSALVALPVDVAHSRYKDVFAFFQVSNGGRRFGSFDEAMGAISAQIAAQLAVMPAADLIRFFKLLDNHMAQREDGWDGPFLEGVRNLALDTTRSASLRSWAISAFCDVSSPRKDAALADFIYRQYVSSEPDVRGYWRSFFLDYARAPSFAEDLRSDDRARVRRALELWARHDDLPGEVRFLIPRLKQLATHPDPAIRELALKKWRSRTDWQG
ncbi:MAG: hypothetical protein H6Q10_2333, partial [Acidobacteria bacterium]|nr:hypothetical protein [Acidobacteriota bacterium]